MRFLVKVRVNLATIREFGAALQTGVLDRSCIRGETHCLKNDPAVGYSIWEAASLKDFETIFASWRRFYEAVEVMETISSDEAMRLLPGLRPERASG